MPAHNSSVTEQQDDNLRREVHIDAGKLIAAKRRSPRRFRELVEYYRKRGASDTDIVAAMISSPLMVDSLGRRR
jgi:hypothetical protein